MIASLSDATLEKLLEDHWREVRGILAEMKRRRKNNVPNTNEEPLGTGYRDGRIT